MFKFFKKAISPVVATALLLVIAVISVVGFQGWFTAFSSGVFVDVETQTSSSNGVVVEGLVGEKLYVNSKGNSSINSIKINDVDCNFNGSVSGLDSVNISSCLENVSGSANIVVVTDDGIFESYKFVDGDVSVSGGSGPAPVSCSGSTPEGFESGSGTTGDPWGICDCTQLQLIDSYLSNHFILENDIDCGVSPFNSGLGFKPIGNSTSSFYGNFDGASYNINNLFIDGTSLPHTGLFAYVGLSSNFTNLNLNLVDISGTDYVGGLIGFTNYGSIKIDNVFVQGSISGTNNVGGLVGISKYDNIINSYSDVNILTNGNNIGGLVGNLQYASIKNSYSEVNMTSSGIAVGGLVGYAQNAVLSNTYSNGLINSSGDNIGGLVGSSYTLNLNQSHSNLIISGRNNVGGLVGNDGNSLTVNKSYSLSNVTGNNYVGGLVGYNGGLVMNSYSVGDVSGGDRVGGLVGYNAGNIDNSFSVSSLSATGGVGGLLGYHAGGPTSFTNSYWDAQKSGQATSAGSAGSYGLTTAQMMAQANYIGWDFSTFWQIDEGTSYPYFR